MKYALSIGYVVMIATATAASADERRSARALYDLTASTARALETSPFDRVANQKLKATLDARAEAFEFDTASKDSERLFNCEYAAKQLSVILSDAILAERPAPAARAKIMRDRARDWETEMEGCRRLVKAPAAKIHMPSLVRRIAGN
ncbi:hypothetical protein [Bosea sp. MMO-172]|uniref:hypothetical protein n=1 Tax=Bosea sp. MMO-172 TaxID=3127885 RepID=UPI00301ADC59